MITFYVNATLTLYVNDDGITIWPEYLLICYLPWGNAHRLVNISGAPDTHWWHDGIRTSAITMWILTHLPLDKWPPYHNGRRRYFQMHFHEWKNCVLIKISLQFIVKGPFRNVPALVEIMAWRRIGENQCSPDSLTHICGTRGRWINQIICSREVRKSATNATIMVLAVHLSDW